MFVCCVVAMVLVVLLLWFWLCVLVVWVLGLLQWLERGAITQQQTYKTENGRFLDPIECCTENPFLQRPTSKHNAKIKFVFCRSFLEMGPSNQRYKYNGFRLCPVWPLGAKRGPSN